MTHFSESDGFEVFSRCWGGEQLHREWWPSWDNRSRGRTTFSFAPRFHSRTSAANRIIVRCPDIRYFFQTSRHIRARLNFPRSCPQTSDTDEFNSWRSDSYSSVLVHTPLKSTSKKRIVLCLHDHSSYQHEQEAEMYLPCTVTELWLILPVHHWTLSTVQVLNYIYWQKVTRGMIARYCCKLSLTSSYAVSSPTSGLRTFFHMPYQSACSAPCTCERGFSSNW